MRATDLTGYQFGNLKVLKRNADIVDKKNTHWVCQCKCGKVFSVNRTALVAGQSSCGCTYKNGVHGNTKHGNSTRKGSTREYITWEGMLRRCADTTDKYYGARGITVCDRWKTGENGKHGFQCFLDDMGVKPKNKEIDRINNDSGYSPDNCHWVTKSENGSNKRNNVKVTIGSERHTIAEWSRMLGIVPQTVVNFAKIVERNNKLLITLLSER